MTRFERNVVVVGAGTAGLVSAAVAAGAGAAVTLIEQGEMGGDCLNTGCVPSKALIHAARLVHEAGRAARLGLIAPPGPIDSRAAFAHVRAAIARVAPHDSVDRFTGLGVDVRRGQARILSPTEVAVDGTRITTRAIIVATGAAPTVPPIPGLAESGYLTSETLWTLEAAPRRLLILGGGPIGCELAQAFARLGSEVTLAFDGPRLLAREDPDVSSLLAARLTAEGVALRPDHHAVSATPGEMRFAAPHAPVTFDTLLVATGRTPRVTGFGLEELGVRLHPAGTIAVDRTQQSSVPGIYACGDVAGPIQLTHAAAHQAWPAAINALFGRLHRIRLDDAAMPAVTYCDPEIARVGLNEQEARAKGVAVEVTIMKLDELDRAITDAAAPGFVKLLTVPGRDRLLGATIVAPRAGEMLAELSLAMRHGLGLKKIQATIHPYPTYTEANRDTALAWRKAHAPAWALPLLRRFHRAMRG